MTNADQPQDIAARLSSIDEQLEQIADSLDLIRTIQHANRREVRALSPEIGEGTGVCFPLLPLLGRRGKHTPYTNN